MPIRPDQDQGLFVGGSGTRVVPIRREGRVLAALNIICISSAVTLDEVVKRYLGPMRRAAARMEAAIG